MLKKRDFNSENMAKFQNCMQNISWIEVYRESEVNTAFNAFHELISLFYKLCFPVVKIKVSQKRTKIHGSPKA